ncbi:MAG: oligosaccharide flippase family protein, partial [Bacteroidota bacterium]
SKADYGYLTYAFTIIAFIVPFMGAGIQQSLLRFGALCNSQIEKKLFFRFALQRGILYSLILMLGLLISIPFLTANIQGAAIYLAILSYQLIGLLLLQLVETYCRLLNLNKLYSKIEIINSCCLLVSNIVFCWLFGAIAYIISLVSIPFLVGLFFFFKLRLHDYRGIKRNHAYDVQQLLRYGLYMSLGGVLSQMLYAVDILMIGNILPAPELLAQYKASSIIPFNLLILPLALMTTDFVTLSRASEKDPDYLKDYYLNYLKIFSGIAGCIVLLFYFGSSTILQLFGKDYFEYPQLMFIFSLGIAGGLLLRVPMGNMLSAIGWPRVNALFSVIILGINLVANYWMVTHYGIIGAAITTSALMWLSGLLSLGAFIYFLREKRKPTKGV